MKKLFYILLLFPLLMITSCKDNTNTSTGADSKDVLLDKEIAASNAQFPVKVDDATTLMSLSRDGNIVTYEYEIDESAFDFETFMAQKERFKSQLENQIAVLSTPNSEVYVFMSLLKDTGNSLRYLYKGNRSGKTMVIEFSNDELKQIIKEY